MTATLTRPAPAAGSVRTACGRPIVRPSVRASDPINLPGCDRTEVSLRYIPMTDRRRGAGVEISRPGCRPVILHAGEIAMAANLSGLPVSEVPTDREALDVVLAGLAAADLDTIATCAGISSRLNRALTETGRTPADRRAYRRIWRSEKRAAICSSVQLSIFRMARAD